jgi:dolichol kinase
MSLSRKMYHSLGGLSIIAVYATLQKEQAIICYGFILLFALLLEFLRLRYQAFNEWLHVHYGHMFKSTEHSRFTGTLPFIIGCVITLYLFPFPLALSAILFLIIGDMCASFVGEKWGKHKVGEKSLEGSAAFFATSLCVATLVSLFYQVPWTVIVTGVATATCTELITPQKLDDNLTIPPVSAFTMTVLTKFI